MLLLLSWYEFSDEKMQDSDAFYKCITDRQTNRQTDTAYHRDARTHLKTSRFPTNGSNPEVMQEFRWMVQFHGICGHQGHNLSRCCVLECRIF